MRAFVRSHKAKLVMAFAAAGLVLTPASAAPASKKRPPAVSISVDSMPSFTPANADPKLAASLAGRGLSLDDFRFTPAPAKGRPSQLRVAIRARTAAPATAAALSSTAVGALTPSSYNLGVAVGWRRFAVAGDVAKLKSPDPVLGSRESAILGVSYSLKRFTGRLAVGAERADKGSVPALRKGDNVSLDVGGSYSLSRRVAVTGGVRYQIEHDRLSPLNDQRSDSQAVYVGTAFKF